jgi:hypothetical protein
MADNIPTGAFSEVGISGIERYGSVSRVYREFMKELQGPKGMRMLREASDNDAVIGAIVFVIQHIARGVTFTVKPSGTTNRHLEVAERVRGAMFDDMESTWQDTLSEALSMVVYGHAILEKTLKRCDGLSQPVFSAPDAGKTPARFAPSRYSDGFIGWRNWGLRSQDTLFMWEWDTNSKPTVMQQMAPPDYKLRRIPLSKCLHFRTQLSGGNPEGRSLLRTAMPSYFIKKNLQVVEAVGAERDLTGLPQLQTIEPDPVKGIVPPDLWNPNDASMVALLAHAQTIVKSVRNDEQAGLVLPWWLKFSLVTSGGTRAFNTGEIIGRYDRSIAMSVMADFVMLGHEAVGSKALAQVKTQMFTAALSALLDSVVATVNRFAIPELLQVNGIPQEFCPTLEHGSAEKIPLDQLALYITALAKAGAPLFPAVGLEDALLKLAHLPTEGRENAVGLTQQKVEAEEEFMEARAAGQPDVAGGGDNKEVSDGE